MKTRLARIFGAAVLPWITAGCLLAEPIGRPTPPPCTADGFCRPAGPWGYVGTQWRTWPGTRGDDMGAGGTGAVGADVIGPTAPPKPSREDQVAPPRIDALDPVREQPPGDGAEFELPADEEFEQGQPRGPANGGRPPAGRPEGPAQQPAVPQPELPEFMRPSLGAPAGEAAPGEPTVPFGQPPAGDTNDLFPSNQMQPAEGPSFGQDGPPRLPSELRPHGAAPTHVARAPRFVLPASAAMTPAEQRVGVVAIPAEVDHRSAAATEAPPAMPQSLILLR